MAMTLEQVIQDALAESGVPASVGEIQSVAAAITANLTQPAQAVDVGAMVDALVDAGRVLERYEDPRMKPLSEQNFRTYDAARRVVWSVRQRLIHDLGATQAADLSWLTEVIEEMRRDARAFPVSSFQRARLEAAADKLTAALPTSPTDKDQR